MVQATVEGLVEAFQFLSDEQTETSNIPNQIASSISSKQTTLLQVVKLLGPALTDEDDQKRASGITLLAYILGELDASQVNRQESRYLVDFFTSSSTLDPPCLPSALKGLLALAKLSTFGQGDAQTVIKSLFKHVDMPKQHQSVRFLVYQIIDLLLSRHRQALKNMGTEFLKGYAVLAEGEKDPRNLKLCFAMDRVILIEFDIQGAVEDLFDITFCYFPITFTPPPDDPYGISSEELQVALRHALAANPHFGPLALPLILDKLSAASKSAKSQSLHLISEAFPVYGLSSIQEYARLFWEALSVEIFRATDDKLQEQALASLLVFLRVLYSDDHVATNPFVELPQHTDTTDIHMTEAAALTTIELTGPAVELVKNCTEEIKESGKSSALCASQILNVAVATSNLLASYVIARAMPVFLDLLKSPDHASSRSAILGYLASFLSSFQAKLSSPDLSMLEPFKDETISLLVSASRVEATQEQAFGALVALVQIKSFLSSEERAFVLSAFNDRLMPSSTTDAGSVPRTIESTRAALEGLVTVSNTTATKEIAESTIPLLLSQLPMSPDLTSTTDYKFALNAIVQLCLPTELFDMMVVRLIYRLESVFASDNSETIDPSQALYAHHLVVTLTSLLSAKARLSTRDVAKQGLAVILPRLLNLFLSSASAKQLAMDVRLSLDAAKSVTLIVKHLDEQEQKTVAEQFEKAFWHQDVSGLIPNQKDWQPISKDLLSIPTAVVLYCASLVAMQKSALARVNLPQLYTYLVDGITTSSLSEPVRTAESNLLASIVNKNVEALQQPLSGIDRFWNDRVLVSDAPLEDRLRALDVIAAVARGLIVRGDVRGYAIVDQLSDLCSHDELGHAASRRLEHIGGDEDLLSKANFATVRLLYKQRFCSAVLSGLLKRYEAATDPKAQDDYIYAIACLLKCMPRQLTVSELPKYFKLILKALQVSQPDLRVNVLRALAVLVKDAPSAIKDNVANIISAVLDVLSPSSPTATRITSEERLAALECLAMFPEAFDYLTLQSQKLIVLRKLGKAVDDKKKSVRRVAVDCKSAWSGLMG